MKNLFSLLFLLAWSSYALAKTTLPALTNTPLPKCTGTLNSFSPYRISKTFNTLQETCKAPDPGLIRVQTPGDTALKFSYLVATDYTSIAWRYRRWGTINWTNLPEGESRVNIPEPGSYYEVSAQGICASGMQSEWSAAKGFNTPCTAPRLKDLVITQLGYGQVKIAYRGAPRTGFYWQYKRFNETSWSTELYERDTVVTVTKLQPLTTYQYRLRSRCTTTEWTTYSEPLTFTTIAFPCDTPHVTSFKARFVTDNSAVISCDPVPGALLYVFYYRKKGTQTWSTSYKSRVDQGLISNLENNTVYEYTIQIGCRYEVSGIQLSPLQGTAEFTTLPRICPVVRPDQVSVSYIGERQMQVNCGLGATAYAWRYREWQTLNWIDSMQSDSAKWTLKGLKFPATYEIETKIQCPTGEWSDWKGSSKVFSTPQLDCAQPSPDLIALRIVRDSIYTFALFKHLYQEIFWRYRKSGTTEWIMLSDSVVYKEGLYVKNRESIEVSIRGTCAGLGISDWSEPLKLYGICQEVPLSSIHIKKVGAQSAELECSAELFDGFYWLYRLQGDESWTWIKTEGRTLVLEGLLSQSTYEVQVQRICTEETASGYSKTLSFVTSERPCDPIDAGNLHTSKITARSALISCDFTDWAKHYILAYRTLGEQNWISTAPQTDQEWQLDSLLPNTGYEYRIGIRCDLTEDPVWSIVRTFTTLAPNFCPTPDPEELYLFYETRTRVNFSYPIVEGEKLSWRYRKVGDTIWSTTVLASSFSVNIDPYLVYEISMQKTCIDSIQSDWSEPSEFAARCSLSFENLQISDKAAGSIEVKSTVPAQSYQWVYRRQGQTQWEKQIWTTTDSLALNELIPGASYIIGVRVVCYQGDTSNLAFQIFYPKCDTLAAEDILINVKALDIATFKCTKDVYERYEWRYRLVNTASEWTYLREKEPTVSKLLEATYEIQLRGYCEKDKDWSAWSTSAFFSFGKCALPDSLIFDFRALNSREVLVRVWAEDSNLKWYANDYTWYYRIIGEKIWADSVTNDEDDIVLEELLFGVQYELLLKINCDNSQPNQKTYYGGTFTIPDECFVPEAPSINVRKLTNQSAEIAVTAEDSREFELRYRVKGSNDTFQTARGVTRSIAVPLEQLSSGTEYEIAVRIICKQEGLWSEAVYFRTKYCDIPYAGRIILSTISPDSVKAYVENYDFNPPLSGFTYTWRYKLAQSASWQQVFVDAGSTLTLNSLIPDTSYELQALLQCKNNAADTILFTANFKAVNNECSTTPDEVWIERVVTDFTTNFQIKCNLSTEYHFIVRYWSTDRQGLNATSPGYSRSLPCPWSLSFGPDIRLNRLGKIQFRIICPDGNIGPWSKVLTFDHLQKARDQELERPLLIKKPVTPISITKLWPNPTSGTVQVQLPSSVQGEMLLSVFSVNGRKVMTQKVQVYDQMPVEFDLSGQTPGLYFVRMQIGKNTFTQRILLQKH